MSRLVTHAAERERELARAHSQRLKQAARSLPGESVSRGFAGRGALEGYPSHYTSLMISRWMNRSKIWHNIPFAILIKYVYFVFELTHKSMAAILKIFLISQFGSELVKLYFMIHYISTHWMKFGSDFFHFAKEELCLMVNFFCSEPLFRFVYNRPLTPRVRRPRPVDWLKKSSNWWMHSSCHFIVLHSDSI